VPQTSAPAPVTENVPFVVLAVPVAPVLPTSLLLQPLGSAGGGGVLAAVIVTLSNVAVAFTPVTWLDTARPISTVAFMVNVSLPTVVHVAPSADS
jgi:hypothetical protein